MENPIQTSGCERGDTAAGGGLPLYPPFKIQIVARDFPHDFSGGGARSPKKFHKNQCIFHDQKSATGVPPLGLGPFNENPYAKLRLGHSKVSVAQYILQSVHLTTR